jgi:transposase-like protein
MKAGFAEESVITDKRLRGRKGYHSLYERRRKMKKHYCPKCGGLAALDGGVGSAKYLYRCQRCGYTFHPSWGGKKSG